jgi:Bifunctional DNA primase/polymerase, N-terminal
VTSSTFDPEAPAQWLHLLHARHDASGSLTVNTASGRPEVGTAGDRTIVGLGPDQGPCAGCRYPYHVLYGRDCRSTLCDDCLVVLAARRARPERRGELAYPRWNVAALLARRDTLRVEMLTCSSCGEDLHPAAVESTGSMVHPGCEPEQMATVVNLTAVATDAEGGELGEAATVAGTATVAEPTEQAAAATNVLTPGIEVDEAPRGLSVQGKMALAYARAGLAVFPLWWPLDGRCACPSGRRQQDDPRFCGVRADGKVVDSPGKHPIFRPTHPKGDPLRVTCKGRCGKPGHGLYDATTDPETVIGWWTNWPQANVGMPADHNGFAILDIDPKNGGDPSFEKLHALVLAEIGVDLMDTMAQRTGSGGMHLLFRAPEGGVGGGTNKFGPDMPGLDIRGRGHYIVVAPSVHYSGQTYEWMNFYRDAAPWPELLTHIANPPKEAAPLTRSRIEEQLGFAREPGLGYWQAALRNEAEKVRKAPRPTADGGGGRNNQLNESAFNLGTIVGAGHLDEAEVQAALLDVALEVGLDSGESERTIDSGLSAGKLHPRTERAA